MNKYPGTVKGQRNGVPLHEHLAGLSDSSLEEWIAVWTKRTETDAGLAQWWSWKHVAAGEREKRQRQEAASAS